MTLPDDVATVLNPHTQLHTFELPHSFLRALRTLDQDTAHVCSQATSPPTAVIKSVTWDDVRLATVSDPSMSRLIELIDDFPVLRGDLPPELRQYHQFRDGLTSFEGGSPLQRPHCHPPIPPRSHTSGPALSSSGCLTMCSRAESSFFWPGMTPAITEMRARCSSCNRMAPSQLNAHPTPPLNPVYPFQCLVSDYFHTVAGTTWWLWIDTATGQLWKNLLMARPDLFLPCVASLLPTPSVTN